MPERANQHARSAKKRKTNGALFLKDGYDSSFASAYHDSTANGNILQEIKQPEAFKAPSTHQAEGLSLKYPINNCLKEHMESIMNELKEAREKLLQWMRQEIQAISAMNHEKRVSHKEAGKRKHQVEYSSNTDSIGVQAALQGGLACEGVRLEDRNERSKKAEAGEPRAAADVHEVHVHNDKVSYGTLQKNSGLMSSEPKPNIVDMAVINGLGTASKTVNGLDKGLPSNVSGKGPVGISKVGTPAQDTMSKLPSESRNALFDMCFGAGLGDDVKDVEGLDGTLESSVTIRDGFEFNKASHNRQKGLDGLGETKSALLDMGFEDEESNEGNGVGCSLESAASSKVNSGFSKASKGIQSGFSRGYDTGFTARFGEKSKEHTPASSTDVYGSTNVKKESVSVCTETNHFVMNKALVTSTRGDRPDDESRQVDPLTGTKSAQASLKGSHIAGSFPAQSSQPGDVQQQAGISTKSGCGIKRSYGSAMTFKGSALESKKDALKACQENASFSDVFSSATSSIIVMKNSAQLPATDKGKVESLAMQNESNTKGTPGSTPAWNMLTSSNNTMHHTLHDSKIAHLEYASRSKLGDAILGSGTTLNFQRFDPVFGYAPQFKSSSEMMDAYQQERANASSMYFSSLCTNNSDYLPAPNRVLGMQRPLPTASPSSSSALRPMLMGMPGHVGGHHDSSNMHTFLGLGMNGVPAAANGLQVLPGLYLQSNQQHAQAPFKHAPSSTSPMVSHQESSAVQEKAVLELNF